MSDGLELETLTPPEGKRYCYCPTCALVATVLSDHPDDLPWCIHHDGRYVWRSGGEASGWTPMVPVEAYLPQQPVRGEQQ